MIKLKDPERGILNFMPRAQRLGRKLGPVLWQLPPRWNVNAERLEEFLAKLPSGFRYAFELRNPSWMTDRVYEILHRHNAAFCLYELAGYRSPLEITASWTYIRLHGPTQFKYQGSYSNAQLEGWARRIDGWEQETEGDLRLLRQRRLRVRGQQRADAEGPAHWRRLPNSRSRNRKRLMKSR